MWEFAKSNPEQFTMICIVAFICLAAAISAFGKKGNE